MRSVSLFAVLMTLAVTASAGELHDKMIGTWKIDLDKLEAVMIADAKEKGQDVAQVKQMLPMMKGMFGQMRITLTDDEMIMKMVNPMSGEAEEKNATYTVVAEEGETVTIEVTQEAEDESEPKTETGTVRFEGDTMIVENEGSPAMPMVRAEDDAGSSETPAAE